MVLWFRGCTPYIRQPTLESRICGLAGASPSDSVDELAFLPWALVYRVPLSFAIEMSFRPGMQNTNGKDEA